MESVGAICFIAFLFGMYFVPSAIAGARGHHNIGSIFVVNLFLGWTLIGWVTALAMASSAVKK